MKPGYEEIVKFMDDYFQAYSAYAQDAATVHRMDDYYVPDVVFIPYVAAFGGPKNALRKREDFYRTFIDHPARYERFVGYEIAVDERKMVATALISVVLYESGTDRELLKKDYLVRYDLGLNDTNTLAIKKILYFWETTNQ